jgi:hypothetical protein
MAHGFFLYTKFQIIRYYIMVSLLLHYNGNLVLYKGRAVAQAVSRWLPTVAAQVHVWAEHVGFVVEKWHWARFSLSSSVSPANHHSTNFSTIIITQGWHNRPIGGRSAEWIQLDSTPHYTKNFN